MAEEGGRGVRVKKIKGRVDLEANKAMLTMGEVYVYQRR